MRTVRLVVTLETDTDLADRELAYGLLRILQCENVQHEIAKTFDSLTVAPLTVAYDVVKVEVPWSRLQKL